MSSQCHSPADVVTASEAPQSSQPRRSTRSCPKVSGKALASSASRQGPKSLAHVGIGGNRSALRTQRPSPSFPLKASILHSRSRSPSQFAFLDEFPGGVGHAVAVARGPRSTSPWARLPAVGDAAFCPVLRVSLHREKTTRRSPERGSFCQDQGSLTVDRPDIFRPGNGHGTPDLEPLTCYSGSGIVCDRGLAF